MPIIRAPGLIDSADPINKGLQGFWPLNEAGGFRAADISGRGRLITLFNGPTRVPSAMGQTTNFASASSQYGTPSRTLFTQPISFVAWIKPVASPVGGAGNTWVMTTDDNFGFNWNNNSAEAGAAYIQTIGHGWQVATLGGTSIPGGVWHCIVATWDGATLRAYRNGILTGTNTPGSTGSTRTAMAIGRNSAAGTGYFNGNIGLVRHFDRPITPTEVARLYREPWAGTLRIPRRQAGGVAAYALAADPQAYQYAAGAVGLSSARTMDVSPLTYSYAAQDVGLTYRQGAHTLDVEPLEYGYRPASVDLAYSGAVSPVGASRTRRGARRVYLREPQATAVFHPNALPEDLAPHAVKAWQDDEDDEWFLLA